MVFNEFGVFICVCLFLVLFSCVKRHGGFGENVPGASDRRDGQFSARVRVRDQQTVPGHRERLPGGDLTEPQGERGSETAPETHREQVKERAEVRTRLGGQSARRRSARTAGQRVCKKAQTGNHSHFSFFSPPCSSPFLCLAVSFTPSLPPLPS